MCKLPHNIAVCVMGIGNMFVTKRAVSKRVDARGVNKFWKCRLEVVWGCPFDILSPTAALPNTGLLPPPLGAC
jgi:hypothetical protein